MKNNVFLNILIGVNRSFIVASKRKVDFFLEQSLYVLPILLFLSFNSVEANPTNGGFLAKSITEDLKNYQYKLDNYTNNNIRSSISDNNSVLFVKGFEISLTDTFFGGVAPLNCDHITDGSIEIITAELLIKSSEVTTPYLSSIFLSGTSNNLWTGVTTTGLSPEVTIIKIIASIKCEFTYSLIVIPIPTCGVDVVRQRNKGTIKYFGNQDLTLTPVTTISWNSSVTHLLSCTGGGELEIGRGLPTSNLGVGAYKIVTSEYGDILSEGAQVTYIIKGPKGVLKRIFILGNVKSVSHVNEGFIEVTATARTALNSYAWRSSTGAFLEEEIRTDKNGDKELIKYTK